MFEFLKKEEPMRVQALVVNHYKVIFKYQGNTYYWEKRNLKKIKAKCRNELHMNKREVEYILDSIRKDTSR